MKLPAAFLSAAVGAVFFAVASLFYYQPAFMKDSLERILNTNHSKARAAVLRLLFNPASAEFGDRHRRSRFHSDGCRTRGAETKVIPVFCGRRTRK